MYYKIIFLQDPKERLYFRLILLIAKNGSVMTDVKFGIIESRYI